MGPQIYVVYKKIEQTLSFLPLDDDDDDDDDDDGELFLW